MGKIFTLSLEVDDNGSIKVQNFKKNVEDAGGAAVVAGRQAGDSGSAGFQLFGRGAEKAGEAIGLPFRASMMLSTQVERMARSSFPAWGTALGGVGVAAFAAEMIITKLVGAHQKQREELDKSIQAMQGEVDQLYKNTHETEGLSKAKYNLLQIEREQLQVKLSEKYQDEFDQLQKLNKAAANGPGLFGTWWEAIKLNFSNTDNSLQALHAKIETMKASSSDAARKMAADMEVVYQQMLKLNQNPDIDTFQGYNSDKRLADEVKYDTAVRALWKAQGKDYELIQDADLTVFDATTRAQLAGMQSLSQKQEYQKTRAIERQTLLAGQETDAIKTQYDSRLANEIAYLQAEDALWSASDKNYSGHLDMQLAIFDAQTTQKLTAMSVAGKSTDEISEAWAVSELERQKLITQGNKDVYDSLLLAGLGYDQLTAKQGPAAALMADKESMMSRAIQTRGNVSLAVNKAMESELMRLVETHKFSVGAIAQALGQAVKQELVALAAKAAVYALYDTGMGLASAAMGDEASAALFFAAAGEMAAVSAATLAAAVAVNGLTGPGAGSPAAGSNPSNPVYTSGNNNGYRIYYEQDPNNPNSGGTGWRPGEGGNGGGPVYNFNAPIITKDSAEFKKMVSEAAASNYKDQGVLHDAINKN